VGTEAAVYVTEDPVIVLPPVGAMNFRLTPLGEVTPVRAAS
jgi:hypothetical protein